MENPDQSPQTNVSTMERWNFRESVSWWFFSKSRRFGIDPWHLTLRIICLPAFFSLLHFYVEKPGALQKKNQRTWRIQWLEVGRDEISKKKWDLGMEFNFQGFIVVSGSLISLLDATSTTSNNGGVFCQLAPCLAQFTVEEDRQHIAQTLREVAQFKVSELQKAGDHHGQQLLQVARTFSPHWRRMNLDWDIWLILNVDFLYAEPVTKNAT